MRTIIWLPLAALCLQAQEAPRTSLSILADHVRPGLLAYDAATSEGQPLHYEDSIRPLRGLALRISQDIVKAGPGWLALNATYRPRTEAGFRHLLNGQSDPYSSLSRDTFGYSYLACGGEWSLRRRLEGGVGLEARMEGLDRRREFTQVDPSLPAFKLEAQSHLTRAWLRAHLAHHFEGARLKPFLRAEAAWALTNRRAPAPEQLALTQDLRPLAPQFQFAMAAGIRL
ncbi:MAG: hypothetical protein IPL96_12265 [Holophagaceae bacterium]|nr:hypothetical protein [Holophagaceae bacterium]